MPIRSTKQLATAKIGGRPTHVILATRADGHRRSLRLTVMIYTKSSIRRRWIINKSLFAP